MSRLDAMAVSGADTHHGSARTAGSSCTASTPDAEVPVYFLDPKRKLGATVNLSGKSAAGGPVTVRLEPCGTAKARLVDPRGKPVAGYRDPYLISMVVTPGPSRLAATRRTTAAWPPTRTSSAGSTRSTTRECVRVRRPGPDHVPRLDPGRDLSRSTTTTSTEAGTRPQGIHRQARRDPRPGRYPDRETARNDGCPILFNEFLISVLQNLRRQARDKMTGGVTVPLAWG